MEIFEILVKIFPKISSISHSEYCRLGVWIFTITLQSFHELFAWFSSIFAEMISLIFWEFQWNSLKVFAIFGGKFCWTFTQVSDENSWRFSLTFSMTDSLLNLERLTKKSQKNVDIFFKFLQVYSEVFSFFSSIFSVWSSQFLFFLFLQH
jgi:hypothetical protein